jgi:hypothetical protein
MRFADAFLVAAAFFGASCAKNQDIQPSDVITVAACPDGGECQLYADGASLITVEACVPDSVTTLASPLAVTLLASGGTWQNPPDKTQTNVYTASLSGNRCTRPTLIAPPNVLAVRVDATLAGYSSSTVINLAPASLRTIELSAQPAFIAPGMSQVSIRAVVRATGLGSPTTGTVVSFNASIVPNTGFVEVMPPNSVIDQNFSVQTMALIGPSTTALTVTAIAIGPTVPGQPPPPSTTNALTITVLSPDGGATDGR